MSVFEIVPVCISGLALWRSWRAERKASKATREANELIKQQVTFQERLTQIEQSREHAKLIHSRQAVLRAELLKRGGNSERLFVMNTGQGTARNVTITLDSKPLLEHSAVVRGHGKPETTLIGPKSEISYGIAVTLDCAPPFKFVVTWDDDSGESGRYETTLTL